MNKGLLERFIGKYNLSGAIESVKLVSENGNLRVECCNEEKTLFAFVTVKNVRLSDGEFVVFETTQLRSLLNVLGDDITVEVKTINDTPTAFNIGDGVTQVVYALAELQLAPEIPVLKRQPEPNVSIPLTKKLMDTFVKARGALPSIPHFTVVSDGTKTELVLGYEDFNTTNVTIQTDTTHASLMQPTHFLASAFKDIILANKEATSGVIHVSDKGFAKIIFEIDGFESQYYLLQQKK